VGADLDELLRIVVLGLEWFALRLEDSPLHVAWPLFFVLVCQVFLFVVHGLQWFSRGMFLPIACDYPRTTSKGRGPCKNRAFGEWHRCHLHRRSWRRRTDNHLVDPDLPRWMTIERGIYKERRDRYGEGSLRARSHSIGLLYYRGYARKPSQVKRLVPELIRDYRHRWAELQQQLRQWRSGTPDDVQTDRRSGVSTAVATVRVATQCAVAVIAIGLVCVGLALNLRLRRPTDIELRLIIEYYAALLFFFAVSVVRHGVWGERRQGTLAPHDDWMRRAIGETAGAYAAAILCAWLLGTIGRSLGDITEVLSGYFLLGGLILFVVWLATLDERPGRRRRRYYSSYRPRRRRRARYRRLLP
jgi:hypothetical protein